VTGATTESAPGLLPFAQLTILRAMKDEAALRAQFDKLDADGKGYIDQAQFTALVRKLGLRLTDAKAAKAFHTLDTKSNEHIQFDELSVWWLKYDRP